MRRIKDSRFFYLYIFVLYLAVNLLIFFKSLNNYFLSDDFLLLDFASQENLSGILISDTHYFRPIRMVIYKLLYMVWGLNPIPYMSFNLLLHIFNSFLVFIIAGKFFSLFDKDSKGNAITFKSFLCGLFFSVHYIHSEAVLSISSTSELLYTLFYLVLLSLYFNHKESSSKLVYVFIFVIFFVSLLTKETAISFILCLFILESFFYKSSILFFIKKYYLLLILTLIFFLSRFFITPRITKLYTDVSFSLYILESIKNIVFAYVALFFSLDFIAIKDLYKSNYPDLINALAEVYSNIPYVIFLIIIVFIFYIIILRKRDKIINFCVSFIFISIIPFMWLAGYERYLYLPSFGFTLLIFYLIFNVAKIKKNAAIVLTIILFAYNVFSLMQKNETWDTAARESYNIVTQMEDIAGSLPPDSEVYFKNLPDNYKGAWIFREGIKYIPRLILKRTDIKFDKFYGENIRTDEEKKIFVYDYRNGNIVKVN